MIGSGYSNLILMEVANKTPAELRAAFNPILEQEKVIRLPEDNSRALESKLEQKEIWKSADKVWKSADKVWCDLVERLKE